MRRDLVLVVALACAGFLVALLSAPVWLRSVLLVPLVLILPGYALAANLFAPRSVSPGERSVYVVVLSIAVAALGGLIVQLAIGLDRRSWAVLLATVTVLAAVRGIRETPREPAPVPAMPWRPALVAAAFLIASLIAGLAIASAGDGLHEAQSKIRFTAFWLLPSLGAEGATVVVGARSHEGRPTDYELRLRQGGRSLASEDLTLVAGERWERSYPVTAAPSGETVTATLLREHRPYRRLDLTPPK
jgi:uncharacterized membrane protein